MKKVTLLFAAIILMAFTSNIIAQGIPETINYQGVLKDAGGVVVPNGNYNIIFQLYDSESGGNPGIILFAANGNRRDLIFDDFGIRLLTGSSSTAPTNVISIVDNGNVGIGTAFPSYPLQVIEFNYAC